jgi:hypothetical protein
MAFFGHVAAADTNVIHYKQGLAGYRRSVETVVVGACQARRGFVDDACDRAAPVRCGWHSRLR